MINPIGANSQRPPVDNNQKAEPSRVRQVEAPHRVTAKESGPDYDRRRRERRKKKTGIWQGKERRRLHDRRNRLVYRKPVKNFRRDNPGSSAPGSFIDESV